MIVFSAFWTFFKTVVSPFAALPVTFPFRGGMKAGDLDSVEKREREL